MPYALANANGRLLAGLADGRIRESGDRGRPGAPARSTATRCRDSPRSGMRRYPAMSAATQAEKAEVFRALHAGEPFVIPNPWDAGSARVLAALGFKALATTSSGFAFTLGRLDGEATLDEVVEHAAAIDQATDLPVSVDLEHGYGPDPERGG